MSVEKLIGRVLHRMVGQTLNLEEQPSPQMPTAPVGRELLLYVHIPFCEHLCPFCTFHRVRFDAALAKRYFAALRTEIRRYSEQGFLFSDVYFGGGTPTVVPDELLRTLSLIRSLGLSGTVSVETNPDHLHPEVINVLKNAGVNRLSVGVQSFDNQLLKEMGRYERYGSGESIAESLRAVMGTFNTLNVDLMFNLPHQSASSLRRDIEILHDIGIDQVSCYPLMPAKETSRAMSKKMGQVSFDREKSLYQEIQRHMQPAYQATSPWCFTRGPAMIDEYIVDHNEYVGVGSGSFSYLDGTMYSTSFSIKRYIDRIDRGYTGVVMHRSFKPKEQRRYTMLVGLFGLELSRQRLIGIFGRRGERAVWRELLLFRLLGIVRLEGDVYRLTKRGHYVWLVMMREFLMGVNRFREQMRHHIKGEQRTQHQEVAVLVSDTGRRKKHPA